MGQTVGSLDMGKQSTYVQHLRRSGELGAKAQRKKPAKYHNKKVHWEGMTFDSIREFERYQELALMEKAKVIRGLVCQHKILLTCGGKPVKSKKGRQLSYWVDFTYYDIEQDKQRYEDVKGYDTPLSMLKIAMVEAELGIEVEIVR